MASDWIKMRVWLARDPKVILMADYLAEQRAFMNWLTEPVHQSCKESAYEHVTSNVIRALCVTGLLVTWGTAREQGDRVDDDLILSHCRLLTLDAMTDIPDFGEAMAYVNWAEERNGDMVVFPKFFKENESPEEKHKRQNAERQARHREKASRGSNEADNVTGNVTVTTEKRREEKKETTPPGGGFGRFWETWPSTERKVAKAACVKVWNRKRLDPDADQIVAHVAAAKETDSWKRGFEPAPLTYLNQERWKDGSVAKPALPSYT
jgi:hypothetical protein